MNLTNITGDQILTLERHLGCLVGLAAGDALGTTLEFRTPGSFKPITGIIGGGPFHLEPGQWTDDTSMALCLAESLLTKLTFDPQDQCERFVDWMQNGHLSSNGRCFDIGNTVSQALRHFQKTKNPFSGPAGEFSAGNGSIMRLAPIPMFYHREPASAIHYSGESSRTTHQAVECIDACRYLGGILVALLNGKDKQTALSAAYHPTQNIWTKNELCPAIYEVATGSFKFRQPPQICGSGYVVRSLEAALWAFQQTDNFRDGALLAVNLGDDADTTGAIYGQLAGACYGLAGIPSDWLQKITKLDLLCDFATRLQNINSQDF